VDSSPVSSRPWLLPTCRSLHIPHTSITRTRLLLGCMQIVHLARWSWMHPRCHTRRTRDSLSLTVGGERPRRPCPSSATFCHRGSPRTRLPVAYPAMAVQDKPQKHRGPRMSQLQSTPSTRAGDADVARTGLTVRDRLGHGATIPLGGRTAMAQACRRRAPANRGRRPVGGGRHFQWFLICPRPIMSIRKQRGLWFRRGSCPIRHVPGRVGADPVTSRWVLSQAGGRARLNRARANPAGSPRCEQRLPIQVLVLLLVKKFFGPGRVARPGTT
jgi:hypothetical protein